MGWSTNISLITTDYEPDRLLTLQSAAYARPAVRQTYRLKPASGEGCQLTFHLELVGVPKMAEHLARTQLTRQAGRIFDALTAILKDRTGRAADSRQGQPSPG
jgi:hypothetical protein